MEFYLNLEYSYKCICIHIKNKSWKPFRWAASQRGHERLLIVVIHAAFLVLSVVRSTAPNGPFTKGASITLLLQHVWFP